MSLISTFSALSVKAWQSIQQTIFSIIQTIQPGLSEFGASVEQSGDSNFAVVGAPGANQVVTYERINNTYTAVGGFSGSTSAQMGTSCDMNYDGGYVIAGGPFASSSRGEAIISGYGTILPSDPTVGAGFGGDVGINDAGDVAVVGCDNKNGVYVFTRSGSTWAQQQKLTNSDSVKFGMSVDINGAGDCIVAGSDLLATAGAVYVFTYSGGTWSETQKLTASDGAVGDEFGGTIAITPDTSTLIVGAPGASTGGAIYVFTNSGGTWTQQAKLTGSLGPGRLGDQTGQGISINAAANIIIGGANSTDVSPYTDAGVVYIFKGSIASWTEIQILSSTNPGTNYLYGSATSISYDGTQILVGEPSFGNRVYAYAS